MNTLKTTAIALLFTLTAACASQPTGLVGKWSMDVSATDPGSARTAAGRAMVSTVQFTSDGSYIAYAKTDSHDMGSTGEGTYAVKGNQIITTIEGRDNTMEYQIIKGKLYLKQDEEAGVVVFDPL